MSTRLPLRSENENVSPSRVSADKSWNEAIAGAGWCQVLALNVVHATSPAEPKIAAAVRTKVDVVFMPLERDGQGFCSTHPTGLKHRGQALTKVVPQCRRWVRPCRRNPLWECHQQKGSQRCSNRGFDPPFQRQQQHGEGRDQTQCCSGPK